MSAREPLEEALGDWTLRTAPPWQLKATVIQAARERLAQLPPYPVELVERIARIAKCTTGDAVAVLDSLNAP